MMNADYINGMYELFEAVREGSISDAQFSELDQMMAENKQVCKYYYEYINMCTILKSNKAFVRQHWTLSESNEPICDAHFWQEMAREEICAPAIEITELPEAEKVSIHKVEHPRVERNIKKTSILSFIASAAAVVLLFLFARFAPPKSGIEMVTLHDSLNAMWADTTLSMGNGTRLKTSSDLLMLREGIAQLLFDNDIKVVVEGPAEFQLLAGDLIKLNYGRIYATVPPQAYGFQVTTPTAKIIDLGTEFGVQQDFFGNTELHVIRGKTSLVSVIRGNRINVYVEAGAAQRVDAGTGRLEEIACDEELFVRHIDFRTNLVWRGQATLDLADIVGGGNGFGTGRLEYGINPITSTFTDISIPGSRQRYSLPNDYRKFDLHAYIDGVFVPNSTEGPQVITSRGDLFAECPITSGRYYTGIINGTQLNFAGGGPLTLGGVIYGSRNNPSIFIHANQGITFDLEAMRKGLDEKRLSRFSAICGISEIAPPDGLADIYVLVDGKIRFCQRNIEKGQSHTVDVLLSDQNRFLTLVTVTSERKEDFIQEDTLSVPTYGDWCMFANPVIHLEH